jgi:hypothetical protein
MDGVGVNPAGPVHECGHFEKKSKLSRRSRRSCLRLEGLPDGGTDGLVVRRLAEDPASIHHDREALPDSMAEPHPGALRRIEPDDLDPDAIAEVPQEVLGDPLMNGYFSLRLFPYFVGDLEKWKRKQLKERDVLEDAPDFH